jgi:hypothetical protein
MNVVTYFDSIREVVKGLGIHCTKNAGGDVFWFVEEICLEKG